MESIHDIVNMINSGDLRSLLKTLFFGEGENGRKAADFIERVFCVSARGGTSEEVEALFLEESDVPSEDVMKLVMNYFRAFNKCDEVISKAFERVGETGECVICYETFENGLKCVVCKNVFHHGCLAFAVTMTKKCSTCRAEVDLDLSTLRT